MRRDTATTFTLRLLFAISATTASTLAWAEADEAPGFRPLRGSYMVYGASIGDPQRARHDDSKIALSVTGQAARKMFEAMGPDVSDACTDGSGTRVRTKEQLTCLREKSGRHACSFGFDLRSGKSIGASVC